MLFPWTRLTCCLVSCRFPFCECFRSPTTITLGSIFDLTPQSRLVEERYRVIYNLYIHSFTAKKHIVLHQVDSKLLSRIQTSPPGFENTSGHSHLHQFNRCLGLFGDEEGESLRTGNTRHAVRLGTIARVHLDAVVDVEESKQVPIIPSSRSPKTYIFCHLFQLFYMPPCLFAASYSTKHDSCPTHSSRSMQTAIAKHTTTL